MSRLSFKNGRWFEKHPKKTIFLILIISFLIIFSIAEKILEKKHRIYKRGAERNVKLREYIPLTEELYTPSDDYMKITDSLKQKRYLVRVDENGYIMPSKIHNMPDLTLVFLGGSTTECRYMEEENRFPYLVGRIIERESGLKTNSYNSGVSGNNSLHSINILINKVIPLKPDIVVMLHNFNDLIVLFYGEGYWGDNPYKSPMIVTGIKSSFGDILRKIKDLIFPNIAHELRRIFNLFIGKQPEPDEFAHLRGKKIIFNQDSMLNEFKMNLQTFVNICKARNITPVLMTQASRLKDNLDPVIRDVKWIGLQDESGVTYKRFKDIFDSFNEAIRRVGVENNILIIDLAKKIPQERGYIYDCLHFDDNGSKLAARIITDELKPLLKR